MNQFQEAIPLHIPSRDFCFRPCSRSERSRRISSPFPSSVLFRPLQSSVRNLPPLISAFNPVNPVQKLPPPCPPCLRVNLSASSPIP